MKFFIILFLTAQLFFFSTAGFSQDAAETGVEKTAAEKTAGQKEDAFSVSDIFHYNPPGKKGPEEKIVFYKLAGWYSSLKGNTSTLDSNFITKIEVDDGISNFIVSLNGFYGKADDEINKNKGSGIIKYDHYIIPRVELFVFSKSEYNRMSLLDHRNNSGTGAKFVFISNEYLKLDVSGAAIHQFEDYRGEASKKEYRWSFRGRGTVYPYKGLTLSFTYFYIPEINSRSHYRTELDTYISYKLNSSISFKIGFISDYNRDALPGTKRTDENLYAQLSLDL